MKMENKDLLISGKVMVYMMTLKELLCIIIGRTKFSQKNYKIKMTLADQGQVIRRYPHTPTSHRPSPHIHFLPNSVIWGNVFRTNSVGEYPKLDDKKANVKFMGKCGRVGERLVISTTLH